MAEFEPLGGVVIENEAVRVDAEGEMAVVADPAIQTACRSTGRAQGSAHFFPIVVDVALQNCHRLGGEDRDGTWGGQGGIHPTKPSRWHSCAAISAGVKENSHGR
jgi:hypothetical protein